VANVGCLIGHEQFGLTREKIEGRREVRSAARKESSIHQRASRISDPRPANKRWFPSTVRALVWANRWAVNWTDAAAYPPLHWPSPKIAPHIPVIDKSKREDGTFSREDFRFDQKQNIYICPAGKVLTTTGHIGPDHALRYQASLPDCRACVLKPKCCPNMPARRIVRDVNEDARDIARALAKSEAFERSRRHRKSVEMLFAHLKRILRLGRLRLRGPCGAQDEFTLAATAQNLRRLAKLVARPPPAADACLA